MHKIYSTTQITNEQQNSIVCGISITIDHLEDSIWHWINVILECFEAESIPCSQNCLLQLGNRLVLLVLGVDDANELSPNVFDRIQIWRTSWPIQNIDWVAAQKEICHIKSSILRLSIWVRVWSSTATSRNLKLCWQFGLLAAWSISLDVICSLFGRSFPWRNWQPRWLNDPRRLQSSGNHPLLI